MKTIKATELKPGMVVIFSGARYEISDVKVHKLAEQVGVSYRCTNEEQPYFYEFEETFAVVEAKTYAVVGSKTGKVFSGASETPAVGLTLHRAKAIASYFEDVYGPLEVREEIE